MRSFKVPEISVVVPVHNGEKTLPRLLRSLAAQSLEAERYEVIVVENGSSDATGEVAERMGVRVVYEDEPNRSHARNRGAEVAAGDLLVFTDADCVADPRWLEEMMEARRMASLVAGDVRTTVSPCPNAVERYEALWRFGQQQWVTEQGWAATANLLVHREAFWSIGGFDESWNFGEDVNFCFRARAAGHGLAYHGAAIVAHAAERRLLPMLERCFRHGKAGNDAVRRMGAGQRAWLHPGPLAGDRALRQIGHLPAEFSQREWRTMARMARLAHAARMAGSLWEQLASTSAGARRPGAGRSPRKPDEGAPS